MKIRCGWKEDETDQKLISHPTDVNKKPEPWSAIVFSNERSACLGTIVHSRAIVTAAHCVKVVAADEFKLIDRFNISDLHIAVGKLYSNYSHKEDSQQILEVEEVRVRLDCDGYNNLLQGDIAIIITKEHINFTTQDVKPACIDQSIKYINPAQLSGKFVGFGEKNYIDEKLFYEDLKICCESDACKNRINEVERKYIRPDKFCASPSDNKGRWPGLGSGGGGFLINWKGRYHLFGILSGKLSSDMLTLTKAPHGLAYGKSATNNK